VEHSLNKAFHVYILDSAVQPEKYDIFKEVSMTSNGEPFCRKLARYCISDYFHFLSSEWK